ncbi:MAG: DMT family transporter [Actinobacteria bacterium]|nr:DMT family transporter [Actinomycetota bacterium]MBI3687957.1 DMT family transporter [Actinomycetota bacterium]
MTLPPRLDLGLLVVAIAAVSTSAPLIAVTAAPALAIAFWRNAMATTVLLPLAAVRRRAELSTLDGRGWRMSVWAGALLAGHFATWVPSVTLTSVASATALVATQPVWAAVIAHRQGRRIARGVWVGIALAVAGAVLLTGADLRLSGRALLGDLLALVGGALAAAYVTAGGSVRARVSTTTYTTICYGSCALLLLATCLVAGVPLTGYAGGTWLKLAALTGGAQLLGHSLVNVVLRSTSPTVISLAILFEMPGAALLAAVWLGQYPSPWAFPGLALLLLGVAVVIRTGAGAGAALPVE